MSKWVHRLTEVNLETNTAICAACGPVALGWRTQYGKRVYRCKPGMNSQGGHGLARKPHGLTQAEARAWRRDRNCMICGNPAEVVDHCHLVGKRRGPLCQLCNRGIGMLGDDPERLEAAARYIRYWKEQFQLEEEARTHGWERKQFFASLEDDRAPQHAASQSL